MANSRRFLGILLVPWAIGAAWLHHGHVYRVRSTHPKLGTGPIYVCSRSTQPSGPLQRQQVIRMAAVATKATPVLSPNYGETQGGALLFKDLSIAAGANILMRDGKLPGEWGGSTCSTYCKLT